MRMKRIVRGCINQGYPGHMELTNRLGLAPKVQYSFISFRVAKHKDQTKVTRGGSWCSDIDFCQLANRIIDHVPNYLYGNLGFRIIRKKP